MPGIPPNAMDLLKNKLKGLLGKKKSKKAETEHAPGSASGSAQTPVKPAESKPATESKAPVAAAAGVAAATAPTVGATGTGPSDPATSAAPIDATPVVPEAKKESAPEPNTVAAAAPLPDLNDTTPASPSAPSEPSKTAETDPIHSVQPVQKSEEPIMSEPVTEAAKPAHDDAKPAKPAETATAQAEVQKESLLAEPTKEVEPAKPADIPAVPTSQEDKVEDLTASDPATEAKAQSAAPTAPSPATAA